MGVLSHLEPQKVFYYFEEIAKIPHGSGNTQAISAYLADFAKSRALAVVQDETGNVIITKEATAGYEDEPALILQGHMDMVAVQKADSSLDLKKDGLKLAVDGDNIYAQGTSLGGDDGIAVAYALALLDSDDISHPRLEVVLTVDEETGMDGARAVDLSGLSGRRLLNLDSEEEGIFLTSCAGGARVKCALSYEKISGAGVLCEMTVGGLLGGHSGAEIHKERGNSNCLMARVLWEVADKLPAALVKIKGGLADNAIPRETKAVVMLPDWEAQDTFVELMEKLEQEIGSELDTRDPDFFLQWSCTKTTDQIMAASVEDTKKIAAFLCAFPNGVHAMSADMPGLVETSLNLGILETTTNGISCVFSVRSSVESAKNALIGKLEAIAGLAGAKYVVEGDYPGWKYRVESPLRDKMIRIYKELYQAEPSVEAIHAGVECGLFCGKIKDLDCVSIGPNMQNIHTTEETLSISSVKRVWEFLVRLLAAKDGE